MRAPDPRREVHIEPGAGRRGLANCLAQESSSLGPSAHRLFDTSVSAGTHSTEAPCVWPGAKPWLLGRPALPSQRRQLTFKTPTHANASEQTHDRVKPVWSGIGLYGIQYAGPHTLPAMLRAVTLLRQPWTTA